MLVLFETPAGHALFKLTDDKVIHSASHTDLESESVIKSLVKLKAFSRFTDTTTALSAATALVEGKPSKDLRKFLKKQVGEDEHIAVGDSKLGAAIKEKTGLQCIFSSAINDLMRAIRGNIDSLLEGEEKAVTGASKNAMVLGLAHSLSRYKLKFSPDKVDTMIVQAISLLDELDKEINVYAMRLREWYGWHFPEMGKIITENQVYAQVVNLMGTRITVNDHDFSGMISNEVETELKQAAMISMGTEISDEDVINIRSLCTQVISLSEYRTTLFEYLRNRMVAIAPNLTAMVGELVGARLIAHAGSLLSLAKYPASTVQILGAEKALFRALKTKHATPKYGLLFHASVVGQASAKHKGKVARSLSAKTALSIRVDALGEAGEDASVGEEGRMCVEKRLSQLEGREFAVSRLRLNETTPKHRPGENQGKSFNNMGDIIMSGKRSKEESGIVNPSTPSSKVKDVSIAGDLDNERTPGGTTEKKKKKKKKMKAEEVEKEEDDIPADVETPKTKSKKDKDGDKSSSKKEKKRKRAAEDSEEQKEGGSEKKKKKKQKKI